jgi:methylated-DNA-[protein]-cysteine S-methyltransferase
MTARGFALFETPIGRCAIAWGEDGILGVQLPERDERETRRRLLQRSPGAREMVPPPDVQRTMDAIVALLQGEANDLSTAPLDMERVPALDRRVYEIARTIPPGTTLSYGEIAARLGDRSLARDVGQALGRNPFAIVVPCHRVVAANGKLGGFSANGGIGTKRRLLALEGAPVETPLPLFDVLPS